MKARKILIVAGIVVWCWFILYTLVMSAAFYDLYASEPALVYGYNAVFLILATSFAYTTWKTRWFNTVIR